MKKRYWLALFLSILLLPVGILAVGVRVELADSRQLITRFLSETLNREVSISGEISFELSLQPAFHMEGLTLANEPDQSFAPFNEAPLVRVDKLSARVSLLPLLRQHLQIDHMLLSGMQVMLVVNQEGKGNWPEFATASTVQTTNAADTGTQESSSRFVWQGVSYSFDISEQILVENIAIDLHELAAETQLDWKLEQLRLSTEQQQLILTADGSSLGERYGLVMALDYLSLLKAEPSRFELELLLADAQLQLSGDLEPDPSVNSSLKLDLSWQSADSVARLLGDKFAALAPLNLSSQLDGRQGSYELSDFQLQLNQTLANGRLSFEQELQNTLQGQLAINQLDLSPWLLEQASQPSSEPNLQVQNQQATVAQNSGNLKSEEPAQQQERPPLAQLAKHWFEQWNIDLVLSLDKLMGLGLDLEQLSIGLQTEDYSLQAPMSIQVDGVPFTGTARGTLQEGEQAELELALQTEQASFDRLLNRVPQMQGCSAQLEQASLLVRSQGDTLLSLVNDAKLELKAKGGSLGLPSGLNILLRQAQLQASLNEQTTLGLDGDLLGVPMDVQLEADPFARLVTQEDWQMALAVRTQTSELKLAGVLAAGQWQQGSNLALDLQASDLAELSPWLGLKEGAQGSLALSGRASHSGEQVSLLFEELKLNSSQGRLALTWPPYHADISPEKKQPISVDLNFDRIDLDELVALLPESEVEAESTPLTSKPKQQDSMPTNLNIPILPGGLELADSDIRFRLGELLASGLRLSDFQLQGTVRDGWLKQAPFSASFANSLYQGSLSADMRQQQKRLSFSLLTEQPDLNSLAQLLGVADSVPVRLDQASVALELKGEDVAELIANADFKAELSGGSWRLVDPNTQSQLDVALESGSFSFAPKQATELAITGEVKQLPLNLSLSTLSLAELMAANEHYPIELNANLAEVELSGATQFAKPFNRNKLSLDLAISAPSLGALDELHGLALPPLGPLSLSTTLALLPEGYAVDKAAVRVGSSELLGRAKLNTTGERPRLDVGLNATNIQLNDFRAPGWQLWESEQSNTETNAKNRDQQPSGSPEATSDSADAPPLLSKQSLQRLDADFQLRVEQVRSGDDWLGEGQLLWQVENGRFDLKQLYLQLPGGELKASAYLYPEQQGADLGIDVKADNFDYGLFARRVKPDSDMGGSISLFAKLDAAQTTPDTLLAKANGEFGFAVWPEQFEAGIVDLWAVSLATAVLPSLDKEQQSVLNCVVARFESEQGLLQQQVLMADTSRIRILGQSQVDFAEEQIELTLVPQAKRAQIFGLSTPVQVKGSFEDFGIGVAPGGIVGTALRFVTSPVVAPLRWIAEKPLDADGSQLCREVWLNPEPQG